MWFFQAKLNEPRTMLKSLPKNLKIIPKPLKSWELIILLYGSVLSPLILNF